MSALVFWISEEAIISGFQRMKLALNLGFGQWEVGILFRNPDVGESRDAEKVPVKGRDCVYTWGRNM